MFQLFKCKMKYNVSFNNVWWTCFCIHMIIVWNPCHVFPQLNRDVSFGQLPEFRLS